MIIERFKPGVVLVDGQVIGPDDNDGIVLPPRLSDAELLCQTLAIEGLVEDDPGITSRDPEQIAICLHLKEVFRSKRWLHWVLLDETGNQLAVFDPLESRFRPANKHSVVGFRFSRFGYMTRDGPELVLLSPETPCRMTLLSPTALHSIWQLVSEIGQEQAYDPICVALGRFGFLEPTQTDEPQDRASWSLADALIHSTSRRGRDEPIVGENTDLQTRFPAPPARALRSWTKRALALETVKNTTTVDTQQSCRNWHSEPLSLSLLTSFLMRLSEIEGSFVSGGLERLTKPIPAAGSIHELEWYVAAGKVSGLESGLYRYCGHDHALEAVPSSAKATEKMLRQAKAAMGQAADMPPALVVLSTRMPRIGWKYKGMAYRLSLLNAGVAIGAMYNATAALGLGGCAIGTGDPRPFEQITGLSWFQETPIAEFALGLPE